VWYFQPAKIVLKNGYTKNDRQNIG